MEPLALSSITMGSNFELAQIRLGDGKANEVGKRCDLLTNIYFLILLCFLFLDLLGLRSTECLS